MINRNRSRQILTIAIPIMAGMVSQSITNIIDAMLVGQIGSTALAAVGIGSYASFLASSFVMGLGAGVQAMVARRKGEGASSQYAAPLNAGLILSIFLALPFFLFFYTFSLETMQFLVSDPEVSSLGNEYFIARVLGIFAIAINFSFRGYWNGLNLTKTYMRTLLIMHASNVLISYGLIFGYWGLPEMGAVGAGWGTTISLYIGSALYFIQTIPQGRKYGFLHALPSKAILKSILAVSIPSSLQQFLFAAGLTVMFWIFGLMGTDELAIGHILITLVLFLILPAMGLGMAATSLIGQALGRRAFDDATAWGWDTLKLTALMLFILGMPMWLAPEYILALFLSDPTLVAMAKLPLQVTGLTIAGDGIGIALTHALLGAGASAVVMRVSVGMQWLFFLPIAYFVGPHLGYGLLAVWCLQVLQRIITGSILMYSWNKKKWQHIKL